jgi:uncharacterized membrane protein YuzA (DUF378 family)
MGTKAEDQRAMDVCTAKLHFGTFLTIIGFIAAGVPFLFFRPMDFFSTLYDPLVGINWALIGLWSMELIGLAMVILGVQIASRAAKQRRIIYGRVGKAKTL